jgi:hypothetical protein
MQPCLCVTCGEPACVRHPNDAYTCLPCAYAWQQHRDAREALARSIRARRVTRSKRLNQAAATVSPDAPDVAAV